MEITVYADILFLVNLIADYCLLSLTAALLRISARLWRMISAALLGAAYVSAVFFLPLSLLSGFGARAAIAVLMVLLAFGAKSIHTLFKRLCIFYLSSLAMGGLCFALFSASGLDSRLGAVYASGVLYINLPAYQLILAAAILHFILRTAVSAAEKAAARAAKIYTVQLSHSAHTLRLPALYDTGNFLTDSESGMGVCIAEWSALAQLFPKAETLHDALLLYPDEFCEISCRGIGGEQYMPAFYACVGSAAGKTDAVRRLVAITAHTLTNDGKYFLILPNDFEGAKYNDGTSFKRHFNFGKSSVFMAEKPNRRA